MTENKIVSYPTIKINEIDEQRLIQKSIQEIMTHEDTYILAILNVTNEVCDEATVVVINNDRK